MYAVLPPSAAMPATVFPAEPPDASIPGPMTPYRRSAVGASMRFIAPFGRLCSASSASSAWAMTSTIALPMAVTSNVRLFMCEVSEAVRKSGALEVFADERRQIARRLGRNRVGPGDQRVFERGGALAGAFERQPIDRAGDDLLRRLRVLRQVRDHQIDGDRVVLGMPAVIVGDERHGRVADLRL